MTLELDNVELYFKSQPILNGIYLKASSGNLTHILGANGSGKSSLLRIIFGDLIPKYKLLRIDGKVILPPLYTRGSVKWLPEFSFMPPSLSLKSAFKKYKVQWSGFKGLFDDFIPDQNYKFKNLSTGEKRIVEAFIILKSPSDIVLLDEPFKSLSPLACQKIKETIREEKLNKLIIGADHNYERWEDISDENYLLKNKGLKLLT